MIWINIALIASIANRAVLSIPLEPKAHSLDRRATFNEIANFDALTTNAAVPFPYKHLKYTLLTVQSPISGGHTRRLTPFTLPNYAVTAPGQGQIGTDVPSLDITGTTTTSFDFYDFYYACLDARPGKKQVPVKCQFTVQGLNAGDLSGIGHQGPFLVTYTPGNGTGLGVMSRQETNFRAIRRVYWALYMSDAGLANTILVFDRLYYTAYTA